MPPRHTYWTIILEGQPTAFRAHTQEELLPTLRQLQSRHPDAVMKWFARGRLWHTPEEERLAATIKHRPGSAERRTPKWRPGGEHKDPRDRFKVPRDEKRRRFSERFRRDARGPRPPDVGGTRGPDGGPRDRPAKPAQERDRDRRPPPRSGDRPRQDERPRWNTDRPSGRPTGQGGSRPGGAPRRPEGPRGSGRPERPPVGGQKPVRRPPRPDSRKPGDRGKGGGGRGR
jgi:hypothetical protein